MPVSIGKTNYFLQKHGGPLVSTAATISTEPGEGHGAQIAVWCLLLIIIIIASAGWRQDDLRAILSSILSRCKWVACLLATFSRMCEKCVCLLRYGVCGYCAFAVPSLSLFSSICVFVLCFFVYPICAPCLFACFFIHKRAGQTQTMSV